MYLYIYLANLFYYFILYQYMCITLNVYIDSYRILCSTIESVSLYKYGAIEMNKHLQLTVFRRVLGVLVVGGGR